MSYDIFIDPDLNICFDNRNNIIGYLDRIPAPELDHASFRRNQNYSRNILFNTLGIYKVKKDGTKSLVQDNRLNFVIENVGIHRPGDWIMLFDDDCLYRGLLHKTLYGLVKTRLTEASLTVLRLDSADDLNWLHYKGFIAVDFSVAQHGVGMRLAATIEQVTGHKVDCSNMFGLMMEYVHSIYRGYIHEPSFSYYTDKSKAVYKKSGVSGWAFSCLDAGYFKDRRLCDEVLVFFDGVDERGSLGYGKFKARIEWNDAVDVVFDLSDFGPKLSWWHLGFDELPF